VLRRSTVRDRAVADGELLLRAKALDVGYGSVPVVRGLDLEVRAGEVVALLGPNGAGKSTSLLGLAGVLKPLAGTVSFLGEGTNAPLHVRCRRGMGFVPEGRSAIFALSAHDNLRLGGGEAEVAHELFPELVALSRRRAGLLSGGEQQMLTLGRALARRPKLLLADELSLGLAPLIVNRLLDALRSAAGSGVGVLFVEQQVRHALAMSDRAYVLRRGRVVLEGRSSALLERVDEIEDSYLSGAVHDTD
jgi:branched-chain amino acid transport system ATP-binding protein